MMLAVCTALLFAQSFVHAEALKINMATAYAADNFHAQNLQQYASDVATATSGRVSIKIHPAGTLLKPNEIFEGVRRDKVEAGEVIMSSLAKEIPLFGMDSLPFIVSGYEDARRMWDASRSSVEKALSERGLQLLYAVPWPPQNLYSRNPINTMRDFKGLRMRAYSPASERISELVGAKPVTIQVIDLSQAISDGKLDLMITSSWTGVETKAWSRMQHYYRVNAWIPKNIVFINKKIFDRLDSDTQKKLFDAARVAEQRGWKLSQNSDQDYENQLAANKVNVSIVDPYIRRYLDRIGENLAREWLKQAGSEELKILLKYTTDRSMK
ncbi:TRAP transporter substrate-binding protein [Noviherbaspirillum cavernae]|nr:TRAP transporter substrate-binding protein [Noviherbaspirillum cavernae]